MRTERSDSFEQKAKEMAENAHRGQIDKSGKAYIFHPIRVSQMGKTEEERIVGLLHDVVEDTDLTLQDLKDVDFSQEIVEAVDAITKRKGETRVDYLTRVKANKLARAVKIYDIEDNASPIRLNSLSGEVQERLQNKYDFAKHFLKN